MPGAPILPSRFADFPREIRDLVFSYIASAAEVRIDKHDNYLLNIGSRDYAHCIETLHDWATRSYIAKGACEVLWSSDRFTHGSYFDTDTIIDPHHTLTLGKPGDRLWLKKAVGIPVDLSMCVTKLRLYSNLANLADPTAIDTESLLRLKQELSQLDQFPRLRHLQIEICISHESDPYFEGMTVVESISNACKELRARIGAGLTVVLIRAWPYDIMKFEYIEDYDISWMWEAPNPIHRERAHEWVATADEWIRLLIADGVEAEGRSTLLEELRHMGSFLPQTKDDIVEMDVWAPWTGITEQYWQSLKEEWRNDDDDT